VIADSLIVNTGSPTNYSSVECFETTGCTLNSEFITIWNIGLQNITQYSIYLNASVLNGNRMYIETYASNSPNYLSFTLLSSGYVVADTLGSKMYNLSFAAPLDVSGYEYVNIVYSQSVIAYPPLEFGYVESVNDPYTNGSMWYFYNDMWNFADTQTTFKDIAIKVYGGSVSPSPTPTPPPSSTPVPSPTASPSPTSVPISVPNNTTYIPSVISTPIGHPYDNPNPNPLDSNGITLDNGTTYIGETGSNAINNASNISDNISGQISSYNYTISKSVYTIFFPAIFNMIPTKIWLVIILGWALEISLIIIKR